MYLLSMSAEIRVDAFFPDDTTAVATVGARPSGAEIRRKDEDAKTKKERGKNK